MKMPVSKMSNADTDRSRKALIAHLFSRLSMGKIDHNSLTQPRWFFLGNKPFSVATSSIVSIKSLLTRTFFRISS